MPSERREQSRETTESSHLVSARFLTDFFGALERRGIRVLDLLGDLPIPFDERHRVLTAIEWDAFCEFMRRIAHDQGGEAGIERCGETLEMLAPSRALASLTGLAASPHTLYRAASGWVLRRALPGIETRCVRIDEGQIEIHARIADGLRPCPEIFHFAAGGARILPRTIGLADAVVSADIQPREALYRIALPPSPTLFARIRRLARTIFSASSTLRYLEAQQLELHAKNDALQRANAALAESERRYRALTETAVDVLCEIDGDGRIVYVSTSIQDLIGYSREQVTGSHYRLWVPREHHAIADAAVRYMFELPEGCTTQERVALQARGGGKAIAEFTARGYDTGEGERRVVLIVRDLQNRLDLSNAEATTPLATGSGGAAHERETHEPGPILSHVVEQALEHRTIPIEASGSPSWHETAKLLQSVREGFQHPREHGAPEPAMIVEFAEAPDEIWVDEAAFTTAVGALLRAVATLDTNASHPADLRLRTVLEPHPPGCEVSGAGRLAIRVSSRATTLAEHEDETTLGFLELAAEVATSLGGRLLRPDEADDAYRLELPQPERTDD